MTNGAHPDVLRHSVTKGDYAETPYGGAMFFAFAGGVSRPGLPAYWSFQRDFALAQSFHLHDMWAGALSKAITKYAARGFKVSDTEDSKLRVKRAQDLFMYAGGPDLWESFIMKHLRNYLTTDNGAFVEIVRSTQAYGSRIIGIMHLDSHRCTRTGDPDIPLLYRDKQNREHMLRAHQVMMFADMPDPSDTWNGVGSCAASRAWNTVTKLAAIETYLSDKVTGRRVTAIHIVNGITKEQLAGALLTSEAEKARKDYSLYSGALVIPVMDLAVSPTLVTIPLSEIPDGFNAKEERDNANLVYAANLGISLQDIQPLSGQGLGTGKQSEILDEASEGQGTLPVWAKSWEHMANTWLLSETSTFSWSTNDIRDQKMKADVQAIRATTRASMVTTGEITPAQALQMAVDAEDAPREFLTEDLTAGGSLQDDQKPIDDVQQQQAEPDVPLPDAIQTKAKKKPNFTEIARLLDEQHDAAVALFEGATNGNHE